MTLHQLRYFIALADSLSFSKVAKDFFVSQSVVSYHIRQLEEELGTTLFKRSTRNTRLTYAGRLFYKEIRPCVDGIDRAGQLLQESSFQDTFILAYSRSCFGTKFKQLVNLLGERCKGIDIILSKMEPEDELIQSLRDGEVDAAVFFSPSSQILEGVGFLDFGRYVRSVIVSENHPLAQCPHINVNEISPNTLYVSDGMKRIERYIPPDRRAKNNKDNHMRLKDLDTVFAMVQTGRGVTCLPVIDDVSIKGLCYVPEEESFQCSDVDFLTPHLVLAWSAAIDPEILSIVQAAAKQIFQKD